MKIIYRNNAIMTISFCCKEMSYGVLAKRIIEISIADRRIFVAGQESQLAMPLYYCPWCGDKNIIERDKIS